jgi:hypothetical protein
VDLYRRGGTTIPKTQPSAQSPGAAPASEPSVVRRHLFARENAVDRSPLPDPPASGADHASQGVGTTAVDAGGPADDFEEELIDWGDTDPPPKLGEPVQPISSWTVSDGTIFAGRSRGGRFGHRAKRMAVLLVLVVGLAAGFMYYKHSHQSTPATHSRPPAASTVSSRHHSSAGAHHAAGARHSGARAAGSRAGKHATPPPARHKAHST